MATPSPPLVVMSSSPSPPPLPASYHKISTPITNNAVPQSHRLRDLPQASSNEAIKAYASLSVKLSEMTTEFIQKFSAVQKAHSQQLSNLVTVFKKKAQDVRKISTSNESTFFSSWDSLLSATEEEAKDYMDLSTTLFDDISQDMQTHTARKKLLFKKLFQYRNGLTTLVEKNEQDVQKVFKEYSDHWTKYGEALEKEQLKDSQVLLSYNHHNIYVLQNAAFNSLHDIFYGEQVYAMLDEIQSIHNDLLEGYADNINKFIQKSQEKLQSSQFRLRQLAETVSAISSTSDISKFVNEHPSTVVYPPPKSMFQLPESTSHPNLPSLADGLQLIDLTQAPLLHILDDLRKQEQVLIAEREKLQTEYESEQGLYNSYLSNPALGDAHDVEVEMAHMRHIMREKDGEIKELLGKLSLFTELEAAGLGVAVEQPEASSQLVDSEIGKSGNPRRTSEILVQGKEHQWTEYNKKFPIQCRYCAGFIQVPVRPGAVCKVCRMHVHTKCQMFIPYCSGETPTPKSPKLSRMNLKKVYRKIKSQGSGNVKEDGESSEGSANDPEFTGIYCTIDGKHMDDLPRPPPREQSLDPKRRSEIASLYQHRESLFEPSGEWDPPTHCVALYDYDKINPNDMPLKAGDVIELLNTASSDWWKGSTHGRKGYFPAQYVQIVSPGEIILKALYDFSSTSENEITLTEGQIVVMGHDNGDGWVTGRSGEQEGLFPRNYAEKLCIV